jgi:hypothetical protein
MPTAREPAPPYRNEGPHALWHVSENPSLARFEPHVAATAAETEPLVWAVDTRHLPLYWFPRDCPRGTFWARPESDPEDVRRLLGDALRVHVVEDAWLARIREARLFAYRFPNEAFEPHPEVGGYWIARETVTALPPVELGNPIELHENAAIELRALRNLWPLWNDVAASTLEFSGIRLRNAEPMLTP